MTLQVYLPLLSWIGWILAVLSLSGQYHLGVYRTHAWLWLPFAALGAVAGEMTVLLGVYRGLLGPNRARALSWAAIGVVPLLLWAAITVYMFYEQARHHLPDNEVHKVGRMAAITLIEGHARIRYPHRLETGRLVMYYGNGVTDPAEDAAAMDTHLARLEGILGRRQQSRIEWIRGPALGQTFMSIHSDCLSGETSPVSWADRHELAHSFLYQFSRPDSEPPMMLLEGWAMSVDSHPKPLALTALGVRGKNDRYLETLLRPDSYHYGTADAYYVGGALVDYLVRRYGGERFLDFYNSCHPETYRGDFERVYGIGFQEMEDDFWKEMESTGPP
jgi:hypothetical protein